MIAEKVMYSVLLLILCVPLTASETGFKKGQCALFAGFSHYQPNDVRTLSGTGTSGIKASGGFGWFNTEKSMLSLDVGSFSESQNGQDIDIDSCLFEYTFFNQNTFERQDFYLYYGCGIGKFDLSWEPYADGVHYSDTNTGFSLKAGVLHSMSDKFAIFAETKFVASKFDGLFPKVGGLDNDVSATDVTYGLGIYYIW
ncbi:MAG: outer membrane beta-barrel protein [Candidatus Wallbacteria bacterium]|nr:outer membrane beta-barrel protein [Candidatus Wallbacteria bacterium]